MRASGTASIGSFIGLAADAPAAIRLNSATWRVDCSTLAAAALDRQQGLESPGGSPRKEVPAAQHLMSLKLA